MKWLLLFALGGTGAVIIAMCLLVLLVRHRLLRRNRVRPGVPSEAPLHWLVSPRAAARLHRRLVASAAAARVVAARHRPPGRKGRKVEPTPIVELCDELQSQAHVLDGHIAFAGRLPTSQRRSVLLQLAQGVTEVERSAARLSVMSAQLSSPRALANEPPAVTRLSEKLDGLEAADEELRALEAGAGLDWPSPLAPEREREPAFRHSADPFMHPADRSDWPERSDGSERSDWPERSQRSERQSGRLERPEQPLLQDPPTASH